MNVNIVHLVGRVGQDPTTRETAKGKICNVSLATNSGYGDKQTTDWHRITFFEPLAKTVEQYVSKGQELFVRGRIQYKKWTDKDGIEKYGTDIIANGMEMGSRVGQATHERVSATSEGDDSLPF